MTRRRSSWTQSWMDWAVDSALDAADEPMEEEPCGTSARSE
jgi:hypothetical protein